MHHSQSMTAYFLLYGAILLRDLPRIALLHYPQKAHSDPPVQIGRKSGTYFPKLLESLDSIDVLCREEVMRAITKKSEERKK